MLFDSHSHINEENFTPEQRQQVIDEIQACPQLEYVMDIGCDIPSSVMAADHSEAYPWCYGAVGIHPHGASEMKDGDLEILRQLTEKEGVVAIGEIGLDFHYDHSPRDIQRQCFREQIALANSLKMPIVIHSREADREVMDILIEEGAFSKERREYFPTRKNTEGFKKATPSAGVLIHCYSGSAELAKEYVALGADLGIAGPITYKNNKKTVKVVEEIPLEFLMIETDAPYLAPVPFRGKRNRSAYVEYTARRIAEIKEVSYEEVAAITMENAKRFYRI